MLRKQQIIFELAHIVVSVTLLAVVSLGVSGAALWSTPEHAVILTAIYVAAFFQLRGQETRLNLFQNLRSYLLGTLFLIALIAGLSLQESASDFAALFLPLLITQLMIDFTFHFFEAYFYSRSLKTKIQTLLIGPAHLQETIQSEFLQRGIYHLNIIGYIDYRAGDSAIPFLGKFTDLESTLKTLKPSLIINCGRNEQHVTIFSLASKHGIDYIGAPEHLIWNDIPKAHQSPFNMPFIRYSSRGLTNWAHAIKRAYDITASALLLILLAVPYALKRAFTKTKSETYTWQDPRNARTVTVYGTPGKADWSTIPNFLNVLTNKLTLVGPVPVETEDDHYDLKHGIFTSGRSNKTYAQNWSLKTDLLSTIAGLATMLKSFFV